MQVRSSFSNKRLKKDDNIGANHIMGRISSTNGTINEKVNDLFADTRVTFIFMLDLSWLKKVYVDIRLELEERTDNRREQITP